MGCWRSTYLIPQVCCMTSLTVISIFMPSLCSVFSVSLFAVRQFSILCFHELELMKNSPSCNIMVCLFFFCRNCIGQTFAMNEMKVVTAMTLMKYKLIEEPTMKPKILPRVVLRSLNGIHIRIRDVNQNWWAAPSENGINRWKFSLFSVSVVDFIESFTCT